METRRYKKYRLPGTASDNKKFRVPRGSLLYSFMTAAAYDGATVILGSHLWCCDEDLEGSSYDKQYHLASWIPAQYDSSVAVEFYLNANYGNLRIPITSEYITLGADVTAACNWYVVVAVVEYPEELEHEFKDVKRI